MIKRAYNWVKDKTKRAWKWIVVLAIGGTVLTFGAGGPPDISATAIQGKYDQATEINSNYRLDKTALIKDARDENSIKIKVGDEKADNFVPEFTISRWDDEVSFKIKPRLGLVAENDKTLSLDGDKIKFETPKIDYHFYDLGVTASHAEGAYEFEVILKEKPDSNVITFDIETQGLDFFYQPALTQKEVDDGVFRPENVIGSYAVYHSTKANHAIGQKNYKAGKAFHIYRPQLEDANGWKVWGELNIDVQAEIQTVRMPEDFWNNAVYPIRHATGATFGYTELGGSLIAIGVNGNNGSATNGSTSSLTESGALDSIHIGLVAEDAADNVDIFGGVYREDSGGSGTHALVTSVESLDKLIGDTPVFHIINAASEELVIDSYILAAIANGEDLVNADFISLLFDTAVDTDNAYNEFTTGAGSYATRKAEDPWTATASFGDKRSIYATYTPGAPPAAVLPAADDFIIITY